MKKISTSAKVIPESQIYSLIVEATGVEKLITRTICDAYIELIIQAILEGNLVRIRKFGSFYPKQRKSRMARDVVRRKPMRLPDHCLPVFEPSKEFKEAVKSKVKYNSK